MKEEALTHFILPIIESSDINYYCPAFIQLHVDLDLFSLLTVILLFDTHSIVLRSPHHLLPTPGSPPYRWHFPSQIRVLWLCAV